MDQSEPQIGYSDRRGMELQELSNAMVGLYKELFGRGPTRARSGYADANTIVSSLENSLTAAEHNMVELGDDLRVEETRLWFQRATRDRFTSTVETITGRKVRAFVSGTDSQNDVATEVFYLEPVDGA